MQETIAKGATRPPIVAGVPLIAIVCLFMPSVVVGFWLTLLVSRWSFLPVAAIMVPSYLWMRRETAKDDQRLYQLYLLARLTFRHRNRRLWKSRSYSPYRVRR